MGDARAGGGLSAYGQPYSLQLQSPEEVEVDWKNIYQYIIIIYMYSNRYYHSTGRCFATGGLLS
jgi:hypothetical protein